MSTYLLAFAISEFTCTEGYSVESGVAHRVCSRPEAEPDRAWAVEIGTTLLRSLESMFGNRYGEFSRSCCCTEDKSAGACKDGKKLSSGRPITSFEKFT